MRRAEAPTISDEMNDETFRVGDDGEGGGGVDVKLSDSLVE